MLNRIYSHSCLLLVLLPLLTCCSKTEANFESTTEKEKTISFSISSYETEKMRAAASEAFSQLSFVLIPSNGTDTIVVEQEKSDKNFASISATVPFGTYELVIVGHNCATPAIIASPDSIAFPQDKITDTFCHYQTLEVGKSTSGALDIELKRCVAKMEVVATDAVPEWVAKVNCVSTGGGVVLNAITGLAAYESVQSKTLYMPESWIGDKNKVFSTYTFLTAEQNDMTFTLDIIDADEDTEVSLTLADAPMAVNQITRYTGELFNTSVQASGSITADTEWDEVNEYMF